MDGCTNCDDWEGNELLAVCSECWPEKIERLMNPEPCEWTRNEVFDGDVFDGSCGVLWAFPFGGPKENDAKFCPGCGHPVKLKEGG